MNGTHQILIGDVVERLRGLPERSVQCCVTSPPYWGLRDDGAEGQIGLEPTPEAHVERIVGVFREVWRVLRDDGVLWLNYGDCYNAGGRGGNPNGPTSTLEGGKASQEASRIKRYARRPSTTSDVRGWRETEDGGARVSAPGLRPKDLVGIPWRVAFALQADGWYLRSDVIWHKPNPMPESVTDRPTKAHEYVFLLTKSGTPTFWVHRGGYGTRVRPEPDYRWVQRHTGEERTEDPGGSEWTRTNLWRGRDYFYDAEAVRETSSPNTHSRGKAGLGPDAAEIRYKTAEGRGSGVKNNADFQKYMADLPPGSGRNMRSVWTIPTQAYSGAHFATFPEALAERCIKAGTSERGACPECGAAWVREVERERTFESGSGRSGNTINGKQDAVQGAGYGDVRMGPTISSRTTGWAQACGCIPTGVVGQLEPVPCRVLDPFAGSGTTLAVACLLGRDAVGIELNPDYAALAEQRIARTLRPETARTDEAVDSPLFTGGPA